MRSWPRDLAESKRLHEILKTTLSSRPKADEAADIESWRNLAGALEEKKLVGAGKWARDGGVERAADQLSNFYLYGSAGVEKTPARRWSFCLRSSKRPDQACRSHRISLRRKS